jgi:hypothetical protein
MCNNKSLTINAPHTGKGLNPRPQHVLDSEPNILSFNLCGGTLGTGLLYQPRMIDDGECGEMVE